MTTTAPRLFVVTDGATVRATGCTTCGRRATARRASMRCAVLRAFQLEARLAGLDHRPQPLQGRRRVDRLDREPPVERAHVALHRVGIDVHLAARGSRSAAPAAPAGRPNRRRRSRRAPRAAPSSACRRRRSGPTGRTTSGSRCAPAPSSARPRARRRSGRRRGRPSCAGRWSGGSGSDRGDHQQEDEPLHVQEFRQSASRTVGSAP